MKDIIKALKDHYGDKLVPSYQSKFKSRIQLSRKTLRELTAGVEHMAHLAFVGLPEDFIQS
jgi:hypothetical protein